MLLCGITFSYDLPNKNEEVILLVDVSDSGDADMGLKKQKDEFIETVIEDSDKNLNLGIVTFGFDQVYAVELSKQKDGMFEQYQRAKRPDQSATDVASALEYASSLFTRDTAGNLLGSARIVLISDGKETDNKALSVIKSIASTNVKVDTVYFNEDSDSESEIQILNVETPNYNVKKDTIFPLTVTIQSSVAGSATVVVRNVTYTSENTTEVKFGVGTTEVEVLTSLENQGGNELEIEIQSNNDTLTANNVYTVFIDIPVFTDILIIEGFEGEGEKINEMLKSKNGEYEIKVVTVSDAENMPRTIEDLREFDEIILANVSHSDLEALVVTEEEKALGMKDFEDVLYEYVNDIGGGLLTVGGNEDGSSTEAHAFTREDMYGSDYQKLLPVEIVNYTPPVAVMIVIDRSGSMYQDEAMPEEESRLGAAKQGAKACLDALNERDYVGIMALDDTIVSEIQLTPLSQKMKIIESINDIKVGGGTLYTGALEAAGQKLMGAQVERRHIILISDGEPGDDYEQYSVAVKANARRGITMSIFCIDASSSAVKNMEDIVALANGVMTEQTGEDCEDNTVYDVEDYTETAKEMRESLNLPHIKDINEGSFTPTAASPSSPIFADVTIENMPQLDGFDGSKVKNGAVEILAGKYVPIYAQWNYGEGKVGSFMCDLVGNWSSAFVQEGTVGGEVGRTILNNIVQNLFPTSDIKNKEVDVEIKPQNYVHNLAIYTDLKEGESIKVEITSPPIAGTTEEQVQILTPAESSGYSKLDFVVKQKGVHTIKVYKVDKDGKKIGNETVIKQTLSYSKEYNQFYDAENLELFMTTIAEQGNGEVLVDSDGVFKNLIKNIHRVVDPRIVFMIISLIAFLLDIAVRKFKFKWIHEIIRDYKAKKALGGKRGK